MARIEPQLVSDAEIDLLRKVLSSKVTHREILERDLYFNDGRSLLMGKIGKVPRIGVFHLIQLLLLDYKNTLLTKSFQEGCSRLPLEIYQ